jgi:2-polyprenyl-6-methoxyphenol hydroxylase-like FAD-dependent oxidoreductase
VLRDNGRYALKDGEGEPTDYDLIVVCVGAGDSREEFLEEGTSREEFPAKFNPVSRQRAQVAGDVKLQRHGMVTQYQHAKIDVDEEYTPYLPDGEYLYSTLLSNDQEKTTCWVIGDVSTEFLDKAAKEKDDNKRNELAKIEFGKIAARTMLETDKQVLEAGVEGAVVGKTVKAFVSQAKISTAAFAGHNLVLAGDAVGAGHWAVGGGMHVAGVCHQKRLDTLAKELRGNNPQAALETYSKGALKDTMAWISMSMEFYYLSVPKRVVEKVFKAVIKALEDNDSINAPNEMQKRIISAYFGKKYDRDLKKLFPDEL